MHPQRNLIQIAEAIGDELYYDSRKPSERGDPEKKKSAELDMMQKSMLMPKANEPKPIQPGDEPTTVGDLKKAAQGMKDAPNHPLIKSLGKKLGKLGDNVTGVDGSDDFYLHLDAIKNIVNKHIKSKTPQKEPVRGVLNNGVDYTTEAIGDKLLDKAIERDAEKFGYDPEKAGQKFYDKPVAAVKGTLSSAVTFGAVKPRTATDLYMKKARIGRVNRERIYSMLKGKPTTEEPK
jgi:hypothetical protein